MVAATCAPHPSQVATTRRSPRVGSSSDASKRRSGREVPIGAGRIGDNRRLPRFPSASMFRQKYLDYRELNEQLLAWAEAHPDFVRLTSIGQSAEGRDIPLLIIGRDPDEARPAVWVDGNMHATELCGSSVALA